MFELLAAAYQVCSAALAEMGESEAASIATDRAMAATERAGNTLLVAAGAFRLAFVFIGARHFDQAAATARTAADALAKVADESTEATALWGADSPADPRSPRISTMLTQRTGSSTRRGRPPDGSVLAGLSALAGRVSTA